MTDTDPQLPRRTVLAAGAAGATLAGTTIAFSPADARGAAGEKVFQHGIASGDPTPHGVLLWTRVTPTPESTPGSGRGPRVTVSWQVARDPGFRDVVRRGAAETAPWRDHTVKVDVDGLSPGRWYFYRFRCAGVTSRTGRTRTAPSPHALPDHLRFGVVSCANWQAGWFSAYRGIAARDDLHAVLHLGDYLYEYGPGQYGYGQSERDIRPHRPAHEMVALADYRQRHAQYKTDPDLQDAHAKFPWIITWDDHEVTNDQWRRGGPAPGAAGSRPRRAGGSRRRGATGRWRPRGRPR